MFVLSNWVNFYWQERVEVEYSGQRMEIKSSIWDNLSCKGLLGTHQSEGVEYTNSTKYLLSIYLSIEREGETGGNWSNWLLYIM